MNNVKEMGLLMKIWQDYLFSVYKLYSRYQFNALIKEDLKTTSNHLLFEPNLASFAQIRNENDSKINSPSDELGQINQIAQLQSWLCGTLSAKKNPIFL